MTTAITKKFVQDLRPQIDAALEELGARLGVEIKAGNGGYDPEAGTAHYKLNIAVLGEGGVAVDPHAKAFTDYFIGPKEDHWDRDATLLSPDDLGKEFLDGNGSYKITGYNYKARKFPVKATATNTGKRYKFPIERVARALGHEVKPVVPQVREFSPH